MKKTLQLLAIGLLFSSLSQTVLADDQTNAAASTGATTQTTDTSATGNTNTTTTSDTAKTAKPISAANLLQQLQKSGYVVKSIEFDKDSLKYKVDAVDRHGDKQSLDLDATKGLTPDLKKPANETTLLQAVKKVEKNGATVKSVTSNPDNYSVTVLDKQGNEQNYTVDSKTGKVTNS